MHWRMCGAKYKLSGLIQSIFILAVATFSSDVLGFSIECVSSFFSLWVFVIFLLRGWLHQYNVFSY